MKRALSTEIATGLVAMERQAAYAPSKGAVVQLTKVLALEFAPHNVQVNALAPAYFTTPWSGRSWETKPGTRTWWAGLLKGVSGNRGK